MKNILEYIEGSAAAYPDKIAFADTENSITYSELLHNAKSIGTKLSSIGEKNRPVAVYLDKSIKTLCAMFGVVYSGNFYIIIDSEMPVDRINKIFSGLSPVAIITDDEHLDNAKQFETDGKIFLYNESANTQIDENILAKIRDRQIDTDPLYALYTSGSTGMPKGAVLSHKNVISYTEWFSKTFDISSETVFGNQTPFYFSMSVSDVYSTIKSGATLCIIPKACFSFPINLIKFLNENKVNTIYWVPSAISIVANLKLFDYMKPEYLKKVLFAGEVMPTKQLNYWIHNLDKDILFANLYGPTETTDICTYYVVDRQFRDDEPLPIGRHCDNCDVMIITDKNEPAKVGEEGELYVRGSFVAYGYYGNDEKTKAAFVQNPLNPYYPEIVYKTGDLVKENEKGEIMYITRKDFQIKRMGYRVELGEIETAAGSIENIEECVCVFDKASDKIILVYQGKKLTAEEILKCLKAKIPGYMMPDRVEKIALMPHNQNGKIDRKAVTAMMCDNK
ncbi:MAG: amino acid adenylation domain-containing protein [Eubacterium sp.]|nr:amino acid adenylation domain-containing protein [Eubacterium sp.]